MIQVLSIALLFLSFQAYGGELTKLNADWLLANESKIESSLRILDDIEVMPIINTLGSIWVNRDGALGSEVSPYIAQALIYKTEGMLAWFAAHPTELDAWLENMPSNLLTNYSGTPEYAEFLKNIKSGLTSAMANYHGKHNFMANSIANVVVATEVMEID